MPHEPAPVGAANISLGITCVSVVVACCMASEDKQVVSFAIANGFSAFALISLCFVSDVRVFVDLAVYHHKFLKVAYTPSVLAQDFPRIAQGFPRICLRVLCAF